MIRSGIKVSQYNKGNCIYIIGYEKMPNMYKIGKTKNMNTRISSYVTCNPYPVNVLHIQFIEHMTLAENILKVTLKPYHCIGDGGTEWYKCDNINILKNEINSIVNFVNDRVSIHSMNVTSNEIETNKMSIEKMFKYNCVVM